MKRELKRLWWLRKVHVVPVFVGASMCMSKRSWVDGGILAVLK